MTIFITSAEERGTNDRRRNNERASDGVKTRFMTLQFGLTLRPNAFIISAGQARSFSMGTASSRALVSVLGPVNSASPVQPGSVVSPVIKRAPRWYVKYDHAH